MGETDVQAGRARRQVPPSPPAALLDSLCESLADMCDNNAHARALCPGHCRARATSEEKCALYAAVRRVLTSADDGFDPQNGCRSIGGIPIPTPGPTRPTEPADITPTARPDDTPPPRVPAPTPGPAPTLGPTPTPGLHPQSYVPIRGLPDPVDVSPADCFDRCTGTARACLSVFVGVAGGERAGECHLSSFSAENLTRVTGMTAYQRMQISTWYVRSPRKAAGLNPSTPPHISVATTEQARRTRPAPCVHTRHLRANDSSPQSACPDPPSPHRRRLPRCSAPPPGKCSASQRGWESLPMRVSDQSDPAD